MMGTSMMSSHMMGGMVWVMGLSGLLVVILLVLAILALIKYLFHK